MEYVWVISRVYLFYFMKGLSDGVTQDAATTGSRIKEQGGKINILN